MLMNFLVTKWQYELFTIDQFYPFYGAKYVFVNVYSNSMQVYINCTFINIPVTINLIF